MKDLTYLFLFLFSPFVSFAQPVLELVQIGSGFSQPVDIANNGTTNLFIVEKAGRIYQMDTGGTVSSNAFLDISNLVSNGGEQGLLGMTFHPNYSSNGYIYVNYTNLSGDTRITRFTRSSTNPMVIDTSTSLTIMAVPQPYANHNAGDLAFGADGYLYFGLGDGGSGGDPGNRSQNPMNLLGKMIRIDVDGGTPYAIPSSNPYVGQSTALGEIWAMGLRNPFKFSFDRQTNDMWIGDVGQNLWEEVNFEAANSLGGKNWGWRCYEGFQSYNISGCQPATSYDFPVFDYGHSAATGGYSITGGYVYRGNEFQDLQGWYIMNDYVTGNTWLLQKGAMGLTDTLFQPSIMQNIVAYGEDGNGELFVGNLSNGNIYRLKDACQALSATVVQSNDTLIASAGSGYQWYNNGNILIGENDRELTPSAQGDYSVQVTFSNGCIKISAPFSFQPLAIDDKNFAHLIQVYPNPSKGFVNVEGRGVKNAHVSMTDAAGKSVDRVIFKNNAGSENILIDLTEQPYGLYFLIIRGEEIQEVKRVVLLPY